MELGDFLEKDIIHFLEQRKERRQPSMIDSEEDYGIYLTKDYLRELSRLLEKDELTGAQKLFDELRDKYALVPKDTLESKNVYSILEQMYAKIDAYVKLRGNDRSITSFSDIISHGYEPSHLQSNARTAKIEKKIDKIDQKMTTFGQDMHELKSSLLDSRSTKLESTSQPIILQSPEIKITPIINSSLNSAVNPFLDRSLDNSLNSASSSSQASPLNSKSNFEETKISFKNVSKDSPKLQSTSLPNSSDEQYFFRTESDLKTASPSFSNNSSVMHSNNHTKILKVPEKNIEKNSERNIEKDLDKSSKFAETILSNNLDMDNSSRFLNNRSANASKTYSLDSFSDSQISSSGKILAPILETKPLIDTPSQKESIHNNAYGTRTSGIKLFKIPKKLETVSEKNTYFKSDDSSDIKSKKIINKKSSSNTKSLDAAKFNSDESFINQKKSGSILGSRNISGSSHKSVLHQENNRAVQSVQEIYDSAVSFMKKKDYENASKLFSNVLTLQPGHIQSKIRLKQCREAMHHAR